MKQVKLPAWLQHFVAAMGGGGIFAVAFLDSSVLSFPFITDALVMKMCIDRPGRMLYYAAMATLGSLLGASGSTGWRKRAAKSIFTATAGAMR